MCKYESYPWNCGEKIVSSRQGDGDGDPLPDNVNDLPSSRYAFQITGKFYKQERIWTFKWKNTIYVGVEGGELQAGEMQQSELVAFWLREEEVLL